MPLTLVRSFPENDVRHDPYKSKEQPGKINQPIKCLVLDPDQRPIAPVRQRPSQLLGEKRLEGIKTKDCNDMVTGEVDLPKVFFYF